MSNLKLDFHFYKKILDRELKAEAVLEFNEASWIHALMGSSGVGKSTLARWLVGLTTADEGVLKVNGEVWVNGSTKISLRPQSRRIGFLSQGDLLFPHLTVAENITYGLRRMEKSQREERLQEMLRVTGLEGLEKRRPQKLSGGEKRRVALAQVLAIDPQLLILDEPFTGLDIKSKTRLWQDTKTWIEKFHLPTLLITHDLNEAQAFTSKIHHYQDDQLRIRL